MKEFKGQRGEREKGNENEDKGRIYIHTHILKRREIQDRIRVREMEETEIERVKDGGKSELREKRGEKAKRGNRQKNERQKLSERNTKGKEER